ncbi:MAG TPA: ArsA-related P-loop ATPase [Aldersonia sp.]
MELFVGKGGVGKSTLACAAALAHVRAGSRVLLASIDQAHSLGDVLGVPIAHEPGSTAAILRVRDRLDVVEIDSLALLEDRFAAMSAMLRYGGTHSHGIDPAALDPAEITGMPGAQELLALGDIVDAAESDDWDVVVVDCGATADLLRTIAAPATLLGYLERIWPQHERMTAAVGPDVRLAVVVATVERFVATVTAIRDLIADRRRTGARLVTVAERVALAEAARTRSAMSLLGVRLDSVVVNKVLPALDEPGTDPDHLAAVWYRDRRLEQLDVIAELEQILGESVPVIVAKHTGPEPVGLTSLGALSDAVGAQICRPGPEIAPSTVRLESGTGVDSVYALRMHLPLVDPASLSLGRADDDLIVGADGHRRRVRLASVLRRCTVDSAELDGAHLVVRFRPDPNVWPA